MQRQINRLRKHPKSARAESVEEGSYSRDLQLNIFIIGFRYHDCSELLPGGLLMGVRRFSSLPVERRRSPREPKNHIVRLIFDDGSPWFRGMLSNLSAGGACVSISTGNTVPAQFTLVLPPNTRRRCRLVWRSGRTIGIEFLDQ
jgi:PilZ domain-containing protein